MQIFNADVFVLGMDKQLWYKDSGRKNEVSSFCFLPAWLLGDPCFSCQYKPVCQQRVGLWSGSKRVANFPW